MFAPFYHQSLRKYHIAFGSIFKNLTIVRDDAVGDELQRIVIPVEYANREGWLTQLRQDPDLNVQTAIVLPRLAFEMVSMRYDPLRKLNSLNQRTSPTRDMSVNTVRRYFVGNPYILTFNVYAITRSVEDANQIVEQILPVFTPDYSMIIRLIPSLGILDRVRVVMDGSPQWSDTYETAGLNNTREIILTFTFNVSATIYGPVLPVSPAIIRHIMIDLYNIPSNKIMEGPNYVVTDALDRIMLEDQRGRVINEDSVVDLRAFARQARIDIVPNPIDAPPQKPVDSETTITEYVDGKQSYSSLGIDDESDVPPPIV